MDHKEAGQYWNENAEAWTIIARAGFDIYRDYLNTPAFFEILPDILGLHGIDIGCGEGYNTRLLAQKGAMIKAIDISEIFIQKAIQEEINNPLNIDYQVASAVALPFEDKQFDFATAFMCFMDIPETEQVLQEAFRVLKPNGFLQFSITHPCFDTPRRKSLRNFLGKIYAVEAGDYFENTNGKIDEWIFSAAPLHLRKNLRKFRTPKFTRTLTQWINALVGTGFLIEQVNEPRPDDETIRQQPGLQGCQVVAYFLHIRCRKPA
ncbi:MAG: class I SAM-dependent methyltransferase [Bacteroidota bacterium]|nr:class I SAM-dependent methyltransferase [Bacteroidota bacterium]